ncbi:MAG: hypothetical protein JWP81_1262 [Ferruginibacter sp.]|nr:hypothetical protein [Ferruginibacter sp.]
MKKFVSILVTTSLFGCGQSRNELMSNLTHEKKLLKDSLAYAKGMEHYFTGKAKQSQQAVHDTLQWRQWSDSSATYFIKGSVLEDKIKSANFTIDSLSKLK